MKSSTKGDRQFALEDAVVNKALDAIVKIEQDAQAKKRLQLEALEQARDAIQNRLDELTHQLAQVDGAISTITGKPVNGMPKGTRRNWGEVRERVINWMAERAGRQFVAGELIREFSELQGQALTILFRPAIQVGTIKTDTSEGVRRTKYFVDKS